MVKRCCWGTCNSDSRYLERMEGAFFIPFPKPRAKLEKCKLWIKLCGRPHKQLHVGKVTKDTYICTKHFIDGRPTELHPHPADAGGSRITCRPGLHVIREEPPSPKKRSVTVLPKRKPVMVITSPSSRGPDPGVSSSSVVVTYSGDVVRMPILVCRAQDQVHADEESFVKEQCYAHEEFHALGQCHAQEGCHDTNQCHASIHSENAELLKRIDHLERTLRIRNEITPEGIQLSTIPNFFQYNTGFTYEQFNSLCTVFGIPNSVKAPPQMAPLIYKKVDQQITLMPLRQQLLLVLMKLRQNFDHKELAFKFNISHQSVSTLFNSWIDFMFTTLGRLPMWPHRDIITQKMPSMYRYKFPTTFAILDCTEIKIQQPSSLALQSETFSNYKSTNTLKSLIVVDPRGSIMFCSTLYTGCISDQEIFRKCGIIPLLRNLIEHGYLKQGDGLMADKEFLIEQDVEDLGLKLNTPPFVWLTSNNGIWRLDRTKTTKNRIHVERAISKMKMFKIVSGRIPNDRLHNINEIWYVVSMLSNFQPIASTRFVQ